jgi:hypothetical protein
MVIGPACVRGEGGWDNRMRHIVGSITIAAQTISSHRSRHRLKLINVCKHVEFNIYRREQCSLHSPGSILREAQKPPELGMVANQGTRLNRV